jgi:hypothetical protein
LIPFTVGAPREGFPAACTTASTALNAIHNTSGPAGQYEIGRQTLGNVRISAAALIAALAALPAHAGAETPDLSGIWWASEYRAKIELVGSGDLPFTAAGKAAYDRNIAGLKDGSLIDAARKFCVPDGLPRVLATPYPFEIIQAPPGQITIIHELNHQIRIVAMDKPMPGDKELTTFPFYNGHSVGHFDGDTVVIETAGFNEKTFVDATGAPHTDEMRTTERLRRISATQLEDVITVSDPEYYSAEWQARFVYTLRNDVRLEDYVCGEPHRDLSSVAGVRRR